MSEAVFEAIDRLRNAIEKNADRPWVLGFSGGKDSTAMLKIFLSALRKAKRHSTEMSLIYCDTGVENPVIDQYVKTLFRNMELEFADNQTPLKLHILRSPVEERFFVRVIGRGYPTPTNNFRWCTKGLRIKPVSKFIEQYGQQNAIVLIGSRRDESEQRRRSIERKGGGHWQKHSEGKNSHDLFLPILDLGISDVWDSIFMLGAPSSINSKELENIYKDASGECPIIKSPLASPCASGRFGCWTCTVVRKDKSAQKMVQAGHSELEPYLEFRNWISEFRNRTDMRWPFRRNGTNLPGPFSLSGRKEILARLKLLEEETGKMLIEPNELMEISRLWELDVEKDIEMEKWVA